MTSSELATGFYASRIKLLQLQTIPDASRYQKEFTAMKGVLDRWESRASSLTGDMLNNGAAVLGKLQSDLTRIEGALATAGTLTFAPDGGVEYIRSPAPGAGGLSDWSSALPVVALVAVAGYALLSMKKKGRKRK